LYDSGRKKVSDKSIEELAATGGDKPTKQQVQKKLDELNQAAPPRTVVKQMEAGKSFGDVVAEGRANQSQSQSQGQQAGQTWKDRVKSAVGITDQPAEPPKPPSPAAGAAEAAQRRGQQRQGPQK
ncbi:MAG: hypothetical protein OXG04_03970, partial [Acidobacteria bacterium]|nr:hypothetical protein [Acidobacteriota bacterium]